jgi:hypothetical protein
VRLEEVPKPNGTSCLRSYSDSNGSRMNYKDVDAIEHHIDNLTEAPLQYERGYRNTKFTDIIRTPSELQPISYNKANRSHVMLCLDLYNSGERFGPCGDDSIPLNVRCQAFLFFDTIRFHKELFPRFDSGEVLKRSISNDSKFIGLYAKAYKLFKICYLKGGDSYIELLDPLRNAACEVEIALLKELIPESDFKIGFSEGSIEYMVPPFLLFPWAEDAASVTDIPDAFAFTAKKCTDKLLADLKEAFVKFLPVPQPVSTGTVLDHVNQLNNNKVVKEMPWCDAKSSPSSIVTRVKYLYLRDFDTNRQGGEYDWALRRKICKRTSETRDAVVCTPGLLFKVAQLNAVCAAMTSRIEENGSRFDEGEMYSSMMNKITADKEMAKIHIDISKSGLTLPHWVLKALIDYITGHGIAIDFPSDGFNIIDMDSGEAFEKEGRSHGYGLGMINEAYTLILYTLTKMCEEKGFVSIDTFKVFNDDQLIVAPYDGLQLNKLMNTMNKYVHIDLTKTFVSNNACQFLEIVNKKDCLTNFKWVQFYHSTVSQILHARNACHSQYISWTVPNMVNMVTLQDKAKSSSNKDIFALKFHPAIHWMVRGTKKHSASSDTAGITVPQFCGSIDFIHWNRSLTTGLITAAVTAERIFKETGNGDPMRNLVAWQTASTSAGVPMVFWQRDKKRKNEFMTEILNTLSEFSWIEGPGSVPESIRRGLVPQNAREKSMNAAYWDDFQRVYDNTLSTLPIVYEDLVEVWSRCSFETYAIPECMVVKQIPAPPDTCGITAEMDLEITNSYPPIINWLKYLELAGADIKIPLPSDLTYDNIYLGPSSGKLLLPWVISQSVPTLPSIDIKELGKVYYISEGTAISEYISRTDNIPLSFKFKKNIFKDLGDTIKKACPNMNVFDQVYCAYLAPIMRLPLHIPEILDTTEIDFCIGTVEDTQRQIYQICNGVILDEEAMLVSPPDQKVKLSRRIRGMARHMNPRKVFRQPKGDDSREALSAAIERFTVMQSDMPLPDMTGASADTKEAEVPIRMECSNIAAFDYLALSSLIEMGERANSAASEMSFACEEDGSDDMAFMDDGRECDLPHYSGDDCIDSTAYT